MDDELLVLRCLVNKGGLPANGSSVKSIGYAAFENCDSLYHIYNHAATPPSITSILNNPNTVIHVPAESAELYKQHPQWAVYNIAGDL